MSRTVSAGFHELTFDVEGEDAAAIEQAIEAKVRAYAPHAERGGEAARVEVEPLYDSWGAGTVLWQARVRVRILIEPETPTIETDDDRRIESVP